MSKAMGCEIAVVGVTYEGRQAVLAQLYHAQRAGAVLEARLVREAANAYDPNAIRVEINAALAGYVPRALAAQWAPLLDAGYRAQVASVHTICGGEPVVYGARLQVGLGLPSISTHHTHGPSPAAGGTR